MDRDMEQLDNLIINLIQEDFTIAIGPARCSDHMEIELRKGNRILRNRIDQKLLENIDFPSLEIERNFKEMYLKFQEENKPQNTDSC